MTQAIINDCINSTVTIMLHLDFYIVFQVAGRLLFFPTHKMLYYWYNKSISPEHDWNMNQTESGTFYIVIAVYLGMH